MVTVILNAYKRQAHLSEQIRCVFRQSVSVDKVLVWNNGDSIDFSSIGDERVVIANCSVNLGVWARFAFALNAESEFVCVLDDDTMPGSNFFANCLNFLESEEALLGARGLRFLNPKRYHPAEGFGWDAPNEEYQTVDIVGHAWFFRREWLSFFWRELPPLNESRLVGEDMHFSAMLQRYGGIKTVVPPHRTGKYEDWGSDPVLAGELGNSLDAISKRPDSLRKFDLALRRYTDSGFQLVSQRGAENGGETHLFLGPGLSRSKFFRKVGFMFPVLARPILRLKAWLAGKNVHI